MEKQTAGREKLENVVQDPNDVNETVSFALYRNKISKIERKDKNAKK